MRSTKHYWIVRRYLIKEELPALLFSQIHLLHSNQFPCCLHCGYAHNPCGAFSNLDVMVQVGPGVPWIHHHL